MIRLDKHIKWIESAESFQDLDGVIHGLLNENLFEHVTLELRAKIESLPMTGDLDGICQELLWAACYSHYTDSAKLLLKIFVNRVADALQDTLSYEDVSPMVLAVTYIYTDHRNFVRSGNDDLRAKLATYLAETFMYFKPSPHEATVGGWALRDYKPEDNLGDVLYPEDLFDMKPPKTVLDEFAVLMDRFAEIEPQYQDWTLQHICQTCWHEQMERDLDELAIQFSEAPGSNLEPEIARGLLWTLVSAFIHTSDELKSIGVQDNYSVIYKPLGKLMTELAMGPIHTYTEEDNFCDKKLFGAMMVEASKLVGKYCPVTYFKFPIDFMIRQYITDDKYVKGWAEGDYLQAWKLYLDGDPCFQMFWKLQHGESSEIPVIRTEAQFDEYKHYLAEYFGFKDDKLILAPATEASKKTEQWKYDEEEPEQPEQDQEDREPSEEEEPKQDRDYDIEASQSKKGYHKSSKIQQDTQNKIYKAFKNYKSNEQKVDSQLNKMYQSAKRAFTGDKTEEILSGQKWTPLKLLKKILKTAAIFSFSKVAFFAYLLVGHTLDRRRTDKQRREIIMELETEIKLLEEKIDDARGDGNRQAKYALMRTKAELERARDRIRYNLNASYQDMQSAKETIFGSRAKRNRRTEEGY